MAHGLGDIGLHGLVEYGPCDAFLFFFSFLLFWPCIIGLYSYFFLFLYIIKASSRLTPYHSKGKKGVRRLIALKTMIYMSVYFNVEGFCNV
jgi:hypothetical protein